ncbi:MAG: coproporphyrinogen III oxidase family protein [Deltaproteobacteria bacterium]|nr:coproporphyrinogen III oxidase family protein [Deltaproteobacteria bacterium]
MPYHERTALPSYFFPFLSPNSDKATEDDVEYFHQKLNEKCTSPRQALLYVHIPFCDSFCHFCTFYRIHTPSIDAMESYVKVLKKEMQAYAKMPYIQSLKIESVYFGGGSPSVLSPRLIDELLSWTRDCFNLKPNVEFTYEGEVRTLKDMERLKVIRKNGCTRVSFGVQSFDRKVRKLAGLVPPFEEILECVKNIRDVGYAVNIDLMYGLPGQTMATWKDDLSQAVKLSATNIDIYDTIHYATTKLVQHRHKLKGEFPIEDDRIEMLRYALQYLSQIGYCQETIEDFALPGKEYQMKKLVYGGGDGRSETIGIGASSIGFLNNVAYRNFHPFQDYINWLTTTRKLPIALSYKASAEDISTRIMVYLPKLLKIEKKNITRDAIDKYRTTLDRLKENGLIEEDDSVIKLTELGIIWADNLVAEFLTARQKQKMWKLMY